MKNEFIEDYIKFANIAGDYKKEYENEYFCVLTQNGHVMTLLNIFEDVSICVDNQKIGTFCKKGDQWITRVGACI